MKYIWIATFFLILSLVCEISIIVSVSQLTESIGAGDDIFSPLIFFLFALIAGNLARLLNLYFANELAFKSSKDYFSSIIQKYEKINYESFYDMDRSGLLASLASKFQIIPFYITLPLVSLLFSCFTIIFVMSTLFFHEPLASLICLPLLSVSYFSIYMIVNKRLTLNSEVVSSHSTDIASQLESFVNSFSDLFVRNARSQFLSGLYLRNHSLRKAQSSASFLAQVPRYIIEILLVLLLGFVLLIFENYRSDILLLIPVFGVAFQRVLPHAQTVFSCIAALKIGKEIIQELSSDTLSFKNEDDRRTQVISVDEIEISNLITRNRFDEVYTNFSVKSGDKLLIQGPSGSGKTTLILTMMGLLTPVSGKILINRSYEARELQVFFSYAPQFPIIYNETLEKNIGIEILSQSYQDFLSDINMNDILEHENLSGGQRARIGIIRALASKKDLVFLDEPFAAIDDAKKRMLEHIIDQDSRTFIIVSHQATKEIRNLRMLTI